MNEIISHVKFAVMALGGVAGWLFGGFDSLIYVLIAFVAMDYLTGVLLAIQNKKVSSKIGFEGISKKVLIFLLVTMGNLIDSYVLNSGSALRTLMITFYLANEGISILENSSSLGLPIPQKLKDTLQQLNKEE